MDEIKFSSFADYIISVAAEMKRAEGLPVAYAEHIYCAALHVISQNKTISANAESPFDADEIKRVSELLHNRSNDLNAAFINLKKASSSQFESESTS